MTAFSQPNIALQVVNALYKRDRSGEALSARVLADAVSPRFPDVPLPVLRVVAAKVLAIFYEPITPDDFKLARLNRAEEADACEYLAAAYRVEADALETLAADRVARH